jgi:hypothetical protein
MTMKFMVMAPYTMLSCFRARSLEDFLRVFQESFAAFASSR